MYTPSGQPILKVAHSPKTALIKKWSLLLFPVLNIHRNAHSVRQVEVILTLDPKTRRHSSRVDSNTQTQAWEGCQRSWPHYSADEGFIVFPAICLCKEARGVLFQVPVVKGLFNATELF